MVINIIRSSVKSCILVIFFIGSNYKQVGRTAFWRLFRYIQGNNEEKMKISMTVPVTMQIQPDTESESFSKNDYTMSFFIPFKHQKDAPVPSAEDVQLTDVQPFCAYVRVYRNRSNIRMIEDNYKALVKDLQTNGLGDDFYTDMIYYAGYNDPKDKNQHNEIWLVSKRQSPTPLPEKEAQSTFGEYLGKVVSKLSSIYLVAKNFVAKLPFNTGESPEPSTETSVNRSSPAFCGKHDCPHFYEVKLNATDYTLRCYPERYRWVSTTVTGKPLIEVLPDFAFRGPLSATPLFLLTYKSLAIIFHSEDFETKEITVKLQQMIKHTSRNTSYN